MSGVYLRAPRGDKKLSNNSFRVNWTRGSGSGVLGTEVEYHEAAVALYVMYDNFGRIHKTLRVPPAMEAGIADHVWTLAEIVALLD
jgi:hypothetical protein